MRGTGIETYVARRDFSATREPRPEPGKAASKQPIFVVQKHDATRLHYDFRLEHGGVLWSWAVPRGPSLDPHDKRLAVHVEDHPLDYADFHGVIPEGQYGAGTVETWDRGTWRPVGDDPAADLAAGEMKFELAGTRLTGRFVLIRLKPRPKERAENWLLIKEHDSHEQAGVTAEALEASVPAPAPHGAAATLGKRAPVEGAIEAAMPESQPPQLAHLVERAPEGEDWLSEIKFDGYRILAFVKEGTVRLLSRNGLDWTAKLPGLGAAFARVTHDVVIDGEMVALDAAGRSDFSRLKDTLSAKHDRGLVFYAFDLLHLDGWDLRPSRLIDRKAALIALGCWGETLRYSDHVVGQAEALHHTACGRHIEGIVCKQANAPYRPGRSRDWVKVKCEGREEFVVVGWTPPKGGRTGLGALHMGFYDKAGRLHYAGGCGTGFSDRELTELRKRLDPLKAPRPAMEEGVESIARDVRWVRPELVAEVKYLAFTGGGRLRHATYLGLRDDKPARDVVRDPPALTGAADADERPEPPPEPAAAPKRNTVVVARKDSAVHLSHPDKELWPGITKRDLSEYWHAVADAALPEIARRPLALVRCPDGIAGQHFFQKHEMRGFPRVLRATEADGAPYIALDDLDGLDAMAQMAAVELHTWGSAEPDALHPDRLVFDLDPGDGIEMADLAAAAKDVQARLKALGMTAFCRTTGGKGLHVVTPLLPRADWDTARAWSRAFAERMVADSPDRYVATVKKSIRTQKILVDWLRNGLGSTAVASFSPRARDGAGVATPLAWREVTAKLDRGAFTLRTVPARLAKLRADPWAGFADAAVPLPERP